MIWSILYPLFALTGVALLILTATKPKLFWPLLIFSLVGTFGLMAQGYAVLDEAFAGLVLAGALLALMMRGLFVPEESNDDWHRLHLAVFVAMCAYMIFESIRGIILWEDIRIIRWIFFYGVLAIFAIVLSKKNFFASGSFVFSRIIVWSALFFFGAYLSHNFLYAFFTGNSIWDLQGDVWGGPAGNTFGFLIAIPAAIFLLKDASLKWRISAWALIFLGFLVSLYFSSRSSWIVISSLLMLAPFAVGARRLKPLFFFALICVIWLFFLATPAVREDTQRDVGVLWKSAFLQFQTDSGRLDHFRAGLNAIGENPFVMAFGYGMHSSHFVIGTYLRQLDYFPDGQIPDVVRTTGLGAMVLEVGIVGMTLLGAQFLLTFRTILTQKNDGKKVILLAVIPLAFLWLLISNIQDVMLLYFLVMPHGLLEQLNRPSLITT